MKVLLENNVSSSYEILDTWVVGIKLLGMEVKSIKVGRGCSIKGSFITADHRGAWLHKSLISAYQPKNTSPAYDQNRTRKLLLTKPELRKLAGRLSEKGLTAVPVTVHNDGNRIVVKIALVKHLNKHDKREVIKERDAKREIERTLKTIRG